MKEFKEEDLPKEFKEKFELIFKDLIEINELKDVNIISFVELFTHLAIFELEMIRNKDKFQIFFFYPILFSTYNNII